jgi:DNA-binding NarL/FixJ family response regulator
MDWRQLGIQISSMFSLLIYSWFLLNLFLLNLITTMLATVLIAMKRKAVSDYWSSVLTEAKFNPTVCQPMLGDLLQTTDRSKPDFLLMDTLFGDGQGFDAARQAIKNYPGLRCIMCMPATPAHYLQAIQIDISGYLLDETDDATELLHCLAQIRQGYRYVSSHFMEALRLPTQQQLLAVNQLSARRKQILKLIARDMTARQIAAELKIAESTVQNHKDQITHLLDLQGAYQLKKLAILASSIME